MAGKKKRISKPTWIFWTKRDQMRFIDAVEKFAALVGDLERILEPAKRRKRMTTAPNGAAGAKANEAKTEA